MTEVFATDNYVLLLGQKQQVATRAIKISRTIEEEFAKEDPAIQDLLQHVTFLKEPYAIKAMLEQRYPCLAVSDGSSKEESMTFGWSVHVGPTEVIRCQGPAYGNATSHRAEGYGALSVFAALKVLFEFAEISFETQIRYGCDNLGLLKRITQRKSYKDSMYPNATNAPDWDLVESIYEYLKPFKAVSREHVKGHQDDEKDFDELPLMVQSNILADQYAGEFQEERGQPRPQVPMLPTTRCQLTIAGKTVTRAMKKQLYQHHALKRIKPKFMQLHHINNEDLFDWTNFHAAVARFPHQRWIKKFLTETLPSDYVRAHYGRISQGTCPHCAADNSRNTFKHRFLCPSATMTEWRQQLVSELLPSLKKHSDRPLLWEALLGISLPEECNDRTLLSQHDKQQQHSAHLPFYGVWVQGWEPLHIKYCNETDKQIARNWIPRAIQTIWEHLHKEWQTITDQMHSQNSSENPYQQSLHHQAHNLHKLSLRVPPEFRNIYFPDDFNGWLIHSSTLTISNWIKSYGKRIRKAVANYEKRPPNTLPITAYFNPL